MKPLDRPLLADQNIDPEVVDALVAQGKTVQTVAEIGLAEAADVTILYHAFQNSQVILSHDSDFGTLVLGRGEPWLGLIYLRPGHIRADIVLEMLAAVEALGQHPDVPFIIVAERRAGRIRVRVRSGA